MLTQDQIRDAIEQMKVHCDLAMPEYRMLSARSCLRELGFEDDADQILHALYLAGFSYCLDSKFPTKDGDYTSQSACVWGPDQLKSRLQSVYFRLEG